MVIIWNLTFLISKINHFHQSYKVPYSSLESKKVRPYQFITFSVCSIQILLLIAIKCVTTFLCCFFCLKMNWAFSRANYFFFRTCTTLCPLLKASVFPVNIIIVIFFAVNTIYRIVFSNPLSMKNTLIGNSYCQLPRNTLPLIRIYYLILCEWDTMILPRISISGIT